MPGNSTSSLECALCIATESPQLSDFLSAVALARSERNCSSRVNVFPRPGKSGKSESEQSASEESESTAEPDSESEASDGDSTSDASTAVEKRQAEEGDEVKIFAALIGDCHNKCRILGRGCGKPVLPCLKCIIEESDMDETVVDIIADSA